MFTGLYAPACNTYCYYSSCNVVQYTIAKPITIKPSSINDIVNIYLLTTVAYDSIHKVQKVWVTTTNTETNFTNFITNCTLSNYKHDITIGHNSYLVDEYTSDRMFFYICLGILLVTVLYFVIVIIENKYNFCHQTNEEQMTLL